MPLRTQSTHLSPPHGTGAIPRLLRHSRSRCRPEIDVVLRAALGSAREPLGGGRPSLASSSATTRPRSSAWRMPQARRKRRRVYRTAASFSNEPARRLTSTRWSCRRRSATSSATRCGLRALEGSILPIAGALVQRLRDNRQLNPHPNKSRRSACNRRRQRRRLHRAGFLSGLYAPHWRDDARGVICGLTCFAGRGHIARAALRRPRFRRAR